MKGHLDKVGKGYFEVLREIPAENPSEHNPGDQVLAEIFEIGDHVDIIGKSKGKGYAGTIKRWRFQTGANRPRFQERPRARFNRYGDLSRAVSSRERKCPDKKATSARPF